MNSCKITIQHKAGEQWPVVIEQQATGAALALSREGTLALDLLELAARVVPREYGTMLGQALFQGEIREAFLHALAQSAGYLSVQLLIEAPDLRVLRWERLCAPLDTGWNFLLLDQRAPLTLVLPCKTDRRFPTIRREDLRALVVVACPDGVERYQLAPFDVETTVAGVRKALGTIDCDVLSTTADAIGPPTLDALCERLTTTPYTLLHLICHGRYLPIGGETVLYLADEEQQVDPVGDGRLLDRLAHLGGQSGLPYCTFLSTCDSASPAAEGALGGLAQRLVRDLGLPAVVAMTESVSISTSQALTHQFYQRLQSHGHLDIALSEAYAGLAERPDSTVAALYSRLEPRPLFEQREGSSTDTEERQTPEQKKRYAMLARVRGIWITGLLEQSQSLYQVARIKLGMQVHSDLVENSWRSVVQELDQPAQLLPTGTRILDMYDQAQGELLILGEPGVGKTTMLLELARDLLVRAEHDESHLMPVIFHLSSWANTRPPLMKWLVEELNTKYQIPPKIATAWVEADQILLLLDGLDEVEPSSRAACVNEINSYRQQHGLVPIVVCCRSTEHRELKIRLLLNKAVIVQPLSKQQIDAYLASAGEPLASVRAVLKADPMLQELVTSPLMLSILLLTYHDGSTEEPLSIDPAKARRQVLKHYVRQMLRRREHENNYTSEQQTTRWLVWLAQQLVKHNQSIFFIERMQPDWLPEKHLHRWYPRLVAGLIFGFPTALAFGLIGWSVLTGLFQIGGTQSLFILVLSFTILFGLVSGSLFGLLNGVLYERETARRPEQNRRWSWRRIVRGVLNGLLCGLLIGFPSGLAQGYQQGGDALSSGIVQGVLFWPFGAVGFALIDGLLDIQMTEIQPAETFVWSWARMGRNLVKYTFFGLLASFLFALLFGLISMLIIGVVSGSAMVLHALPGVLNNTGQALMATPFLTLTSGLLGGLVGGLSGETMDVRNLTTPNLGIRRSAKHGLLVGVAVGLIGFLVVAAIFLALTDISFLFTGLTYGLVVGILTGVISGLRSGGIACFEHLVLRWLLWRNGFISWKYAHFLDYAAERILLRKVGGGYIFTHRLLLEYFAALETTPLSERVADAEQDEIHQ